MKTAAGIKEKAVKDFLDKPDVGGYTRSDTLPDAVRRHARVSEIDYYFEPLRLP